MTRAPTDRSHLSIGEVLSLLQEEFPDVTISKIRFLESQGLLDPERTPSGYRKFYEGDIDRLRWILRQQKDHYLPLKVIKDRLDETGPIRTAPTAATPAHLDAPDEAGTGAGPLPSHAPAAMAAAATGTVDVGRHHQYPSAVALDDRPAPEARTAPAVPHPQPAPAPPPAPPAGRAPTADPTPHRPDRRAPVRAPTTDAWPGCSASAPPAPARPVAASGPTARSRPSRCGP